MIAGTHFRGDLIESTAVLVRGTLILLYSRFSGVIVRRGVFSRLLFTYTTVIHRSGGRPRFLGGGWGGGGYVCLDSPQNVVFHRSRRRRAHRSQNVALSVMPACMHANNQDCSTGAEHADSTVDTTEPTTKYIHDVHHNGTVRFMAPPLVSTCPDGLSRFMRLRKKTMPMTALSKTNLCSTAWDRVRLETVALLAACARSYSTGDSFRSICRCSHCCISLSGCQCTATHLRRWSCRNKNLAQ